MLLQYFSFINYNGVPPRVISKVKEGRDGKVCYHFQMKSFQWQLHKQKLLPYSYWKLLNWNFSKAFGVTWLLK